MVHKRRMCDESSDLLIALLLLLFFKNVPGIH